MGLGFLDPTRLLQKRWASAEDLAMELYHQATQPGTAQVQRPVEIAKPSGRPALKSDYTPRPPEQPRPEAPRQPRQEQFQDAGQSTGVVRPGFQFPQQQGPAPAALDAMRTARNIAEVARQGIGSLIQAEGERIVREYVVEPTTRLASAAVKSAVESLSSPPARTQVAARPTQRPARHAERQEAARSPFVGLADIEHAEIESRSQGQPRASGSAEPTAYTPKGPSYGYRQPAGLGRPEHIDPVADIAGPVVFRGPDPVQFESMPMVYDRRGGGYRDLASSVALQADWQRWLTIDAKICWCDDAGVSAASLAAPPSTPRLGTGTVTMYQVDQDKDELQPIDDSESEEGSESKAKIYSLYAFPFKNCFAIAKMLGDHWFIFPLGSLIVATTRDGGIPAGQSATCDLYSTAGGNTVAAGEAGVGNNFSATVGETAGTTILAGIDTAGQLRVVAEDCG